ncbi:hypothetical protein B0T14DRAFT_569149 [Immersiella caudata]|uniref:Uncharacterized protein n=1 Tax=Immersiella caudata TaxID=314043 RepID=A0AA40BXX4_9PEZI|nr:hypothetical protein B0T14DRAFT_569149 [Immersiella caudata]
MGSPEISSLTNDETKEEQQGGGGGERPKFIIVGLLRWLGTAVLVALFYLSSTFTRAASWTSGQKAIFDWLVVTSSLALGLNSATSLRHIAIFVALLQLLFRTSVLLIKVNCILWLLLNLAIQTAIGLTF